MGIRFKSKKEELVKKPREAILAAVEVYNNPSITFKSEAFITLAVIGWTYLFHAYYISIGHDFRYYQMHGKRKRYERTKQGSFKYWELEKCLNESQCPIDVNVSNNLKYLIGLRHEIEHQMTNRIDDLISAKIMACAINYNKTICALFGDKHNMERELSIAIQFSPVSPAQEKMMKGLQPISNFINRYTSSFESNLSDEEQCSSQYSYRLLFVPINAKRKGQADRVVEFIPFDSPLAEGMNKEYQLIRETEKKKYLPHEVIEKMNNEGYKKFGMYLHTHLWQSMDARNPKYSYGVMVSSQWFWYETWVEVARKFCAEKYGSC